MYNLLIIHVLLTENRKLKTENGIRGRAIIPAEGGVVKERYMEKIMCKEKFLILLTIPPGQLS
jgi:hypothetical protein